MVRLRSCSTATASASPESTSASALVKLAFTIIVPLKWALMIGRILCRSGAPAQAFVSVT
jgi:hypothetical protein